MREPKFTEIEEVYDEDSELYFYRVAISYPCYTPMEKFKDHKTAEKAQQCAEKALESLTTSWEGERPRRRLLTGERPKLGVINGGKG